MLTEAVSGVAFNSRFTAVVNHVDAEVVRVVVAVYFLGSPSLA
jgi:hypothetical protein